METIKEQLEKKVHYSYKWHKQDNGRYTATIKCNGTVVEYIEEKLTLENLHSTVLEYYPTARCMNGALIEE